MLAAIKDPFPFQLLSFLMYVMGTYLLAEMVQNYRRRKHANPTSRTRSVRSIATAWLRKPLELHRSRMEVVRRMETARRDAIEAAAMRHPSAFRARQAAMNAHPAGSTLQSRTG